MNSQKEKNSLFNQCINEFKSNHRRIFLQSDILEIKSKKEEILNKAEPFSFNITKEPEIYKGVIKQEFAEIVSRSVANEYKDAQKEFTVEQKFEKYCKNFWQREEMKKPVPFMKDGWGGAGLIINNDRSWLSDERDLVIHTDDYRFVLFTKEIYALCNEITNGSNKDYFFEIIGKTLYKFQKENFVKEMTQEIFSELVKGIRTFIEEELRHLNTYKEKMERYSNPENYIF